jgi:hypothetical protein
MDPFLVNMGWNVKCPYRHLPVAWNGKAPGWNGTGEWNGKAEGNVRPWSRRTSEDVIIVRAPMSDTSGPR